MSVASTLSSGRAAAEALMQDTFMAKAPSGGDTKDADGFLVPDYLDMGITPGRIKGQSAQSRDTYTRTVRVGDVDLPVIQGGLSIPVGKYVTSDGLAIRASERKGIAWEFECTATGPATDPALKGSRWLVVNAPVESSATARRLDVVRLS